MKFKTNIKCTGCIATVTPYLNETIGEQEWEVNIEDPQKILTVNAAVEESKIKEALQKAGYKGERLAE